MNRAWDAIVIGAGHNGLVAATMLARKGLRTLVAEARPHPGGMLGDAGFRIAPLPFALRPEIAAELGIRLKARPVETVFAGRDGGLVRVSGGRAEGIAPDEARRFADFYGELARMAGAVSGMLLNPPPALGGNGMAELLALGRTGLKLRGLGRSGLRELLRIALSNAWDVVHDAIGEGPLAGMLAMDATLGGAMGPRSPGTVLPLLYRMTVQSAAGQGVRMMPEAGPQALADALASAFAKAGGELRLDAPVRRILVADDRVAGVVLASGESIRAPLVLSNAAPGTTLLHLLGPEHLDAEFVRRCRLMATDGMVARIDFALSGDPRLAGGGTPTGFQRLVIAQDTQAVESAFDAAKHGKLPEAPVLEARYDPQAGVVQATVQFVPGKGWDDRQLTVPKLEKAVLKSLDHLLPGIGKLVTGAWTMTPPDIAKAYGVPGGHWHHGEFRIDQLLMLRPFHGAGHYRMPVEGLYLCGAGSHPGGDISGAPGFNAARLVLREGRR